MPIAPYAKLRASIAGGAVQTGGIISSGGQSVQLSADPAGVAGANSYLWEIYDYPINFTQPSGWTLGTGGVYQSTAATPSAFTLADISRWGKYLLRLTLNGNRSTNQNSYLVDEVTAIQVKSPLGLNSIAYLEASQFDSKTWAGQLKQDFTLLATAVSGSTSATAATTASFVQPASGANVSVSMSATSWFSTGAYLFINGGGYYQVASVTDSTHAVLTNLGYSGNASAATTVASPSLVAASGPQGLSAQNIYIKTVISSNVASLGSSPTANDGYTFVNGDVIALSNQTTGSNNRLYTYGSGTLTPLSSQPTNGSLLLVTNGVTLVGRLYSYQTNSVSQIAANVSVIQGTYTTTTIAPDALGVVLLDNIAIPVQTIATGGAWVTVYSFDFVGRGYTAPGSFNIKVEVNAADGPKSVRMRAEAEVFSSATPTIGASTTIDILDDSSGAGGYAGMQIIMGSSTRLDVQMKNLQAADRKYGGIAGIKIIKA